MELKDAHCFGYGYLAMDVTNEFGEAFSMKGSKKIPTDLKIGRFSPKRINISLPTMDIMGDLDAGYGCSFTICDLWI